MKKLFLLLTIAAAMWQVCVADLPDTVWTRSFEPEDVIDAKFSPDDSLIYVATSGGVYSVETRTGSVIRKYATIPGEVYALDVSKDGSKLAVAHHKQVLIFNTLIGDNFHIINESTSIVDVTFSSDNNYLVYAPTEKVEDSTIFCVVSLIEKTIYKKITTFGLPHRFCKYSNDGLKLATVQWTENIGKSAEGKIFVWETQNWTKKSIGYHLAHVQDLKISHDGKYIATAALDSTAKVWDIETWKVVLSVKPENIRMNVTGVDFSKDSKYLVTGSGAPAEQNIKIWDMKTGNSIYHYKQNGYGMIHVSNNNKFITTYILSPISKLILLNAKWSPTSVIEGLENKETEIRTIPTPFSDVVKIEFNLPKPGMVQALISNETGENVFVFPEKFFSEGKNTLEWKPQNLAQGIYFCTIKSDDFFIIVKLLLQK